MDPWKRERVTSYAEDDGEALVAAPHTEAELAQVLARARALGKRVSFQAGRQSLDKHPLPARAGATCCARARPSASCPTWW